VEVQGVSVRVLNPLKPISPRRPVLSDRESNNESLVLKITFRDIGILLCGDIATPAETALLHSGADLKSSVLLVPHHGARQSCTEPFLMRVRPEHAVISARETSFSRTPHPEVVERLERSGIKIYRTDLHGAVTVETDGQSVRITTHKPLPE
jgi:competence protein ComEC